MTARRRAVATASDPSGLPPELAAGPADVHDRDIYIAWASAGREWSQRVLGNPNGWRALLTPEVRMAASSRSKFIN